MMVSGALKPSGWPYSSIVLPSSPTFFRQMVQGAVYDQLATELIPATLQSQDWYQLSLGRIETTDHQT
ncbi:hypothetical protein [Rosenbergiella nectarea]|uniref:hypothetical protein n=1 Tax=Rosenbergiella nectarea TaxID=988801 RepID=UPI001F4FC8B3